MTIRMVPQDLLVRIDETVTAYILWPQDQMTLSKYSDLEDDQMTKLRPYIYRITASETSKLKELCALATCKDITKCKTMISNITDGTSSGSMTGQKQTGTSFNWVINMLQLHDNSERRYAMSPSASYNGFLFLFYLEVFTNIYYKVTKLKHGWLIICNLKISKMLICKRKVCKLRISFIFETCQ